MRIRQYASVAATRAALGAGGPKRARARARSWKITVSCPSLVELRGRHAEVPGDHRSEKTVPAGVRRPAAGAAPRRLDRRPERPLRGRLGGDERLLAAEVRQPIGLQGRPDRQDHGRDRGPGAPARRASRPQPAAPATASTARAAKK